MWRHFPNTTNVVHCYSQSLLTNCSTLIKIYGKSICIPLRQVISTLHWIKSLLKCLQNKSKSCRFHAEMSRYENAIWNATKNLFWNFKQLVHVFSRFSAFKLHQTASKKSKFHITQLISREIQTISTYEPTGEVCSKLSNNNPLPGALYNLICGTNWNADKDYYRNLYLFVCRVCKSFYMARRGNWRLLNHFVIQLFFILYKWLRCTR